MVWNKKGFTIAELMVTLAIIGILFATAVPVYHTWQQRAYGSEAAIMLKQLISAEISYYLENDEYFPKDVVYEIYHDGAQIPGEAVKNVKDNLKIEIPQGHFIDYQLSYDEKGDFILNISSSGDFEIFKGTRHVSAHLDKEGKVTIYIP